MLYTGAYPDLPDEKSVQNLAYTSVRVLNKWRYSWICCLVTFIKRIILEVMKRDNQKQPGMARLYPNIAEWVETRGWVELGSDMHCNSWVRCLDEGGDIWVSSKKHKTLDQALEALEAFLKKELEQ